MYRATLHIGFIIAFIAQCTPSYVFSQESITIMVDGINRIDTVSFGNQLSYIYIYDEVGNRINRDVEVDIEVADFEIDITPINGCDPGVVTVTPSYPFFYTATLEFIEALGAPGCPGYNPGTTPHTDIPSNYPPATFTAETNYAARYNLCITIDGIASSIWEKCTEIEVTDETIVDFGGENFSLTKENFTVCKDGSMNINTIDTVACHPFVLNLTKDDDPSFSECRTFYHETEFNETLEPGEYQACIDVRGLNQDSFSTHCIPFTIEDDTYEHINENNFDIHTTPMNGCEFGTVNIVATESLPCQDFKVRIRNVDTGLFPPSFTFDMETIFDYSYGNYEACITYEIDNGFDNEVCIPFEVANVTNFNLNGLFYEQVPLTTCHLGGINLRVPNYLACYNYRLEITDDEGNFVSELQYLGGDQGFTVPEVGLYSACLRVDAFPDGHLAEYCFDFEVFEKPEFTIETDVRLVGNTTQFVFFEVVGAELPVFVSVNGQLRQFNTLSFSVPLYDVVNEITFWTSLNCEGIYEEVRLLDSTFRVYPNPTRDQLTILLPVVLQQGLTYHMVIYNAIGQEMARYDLDSNINPQTIDVSHLAAGEYNLVLEINGFLVTKKFIKQ